jgi:hypothetical protein
MIILQFSLRYNSDDKTADWKYFQTWVTNSQGVIGAHEVIRVIIFLNILLDIILIFNLKIVRAAM